MEHDYIIEIQILDGQRLVRDLRETVDGRWPHIALLKVAKQVADAVGDDYDQHNVKMKERKDA